MICTQFNKHIIQCTITSGSRIGHSVLLPRIDMKPLENDPKMAGTLVRRQFPIKVITQNNFQKYKFNI